jgi:general stress protein 26
VNLAFVGNSSWLSITGRGKALHDRGLVDELWNSAAEAWFPDGPGDARLGVLRVRGRTAEYWDTPGGRIATVLSSIKAKATGHPIDADNETVRLR